MPSHARAGLLTIVMLGLACARGPEEPTPRADLVGVWDLVAVNGAALPAPSPEEPSVQLQGVVMTLGGDGVYALASSFQVDGQAAQDMTIGGTWEATEDALVFHNEQGPAIVQFGYTREGGDIVLVDEELNQWTMRRRR